MENIIIITVGMILVLGLWWAILLPKQQEPEDEEDSIQKNTSGTWHLAGVEQRGQMPENEPEHTPPTPGLCPACGTDNDPVYTFCRNCIRRLGPP